MIDKWTVKEEMTKSILKTRHFFLSGHEVGQPVLKTLWRFEVLMGGFSSEDGPIAFHGEKTDNLTHQSMLKGLKWSGPASEGRARPRAAPPSCRRHKGGAGTGPTRCQEDLQGEAPYFGEPEGNRRRCCLQPLCSLLALIAARNSSQALSPPPKQNLQWRVAAFPFPQ